MTLEEAIQEFEDNAFYPSMKSNISDEAKSIALKCMYDKLYSPVISGDEAELIWKESNKPKSEKETLGKEMLKKMWDKFENLSND